jgi:hypothetical protein
MGRHVPSACFGIRGGGNLHVCRFVVIDACGVSARVFCMPMNGYMP